MAISPHVSPSNELPPSADQHESFLEVIRANRSVLLSLTGNHFSLELGQQTSFDYNRRRVIIGQEQLMHMGVRERNELLFITLHELGHLKEFMDDPDGYLKLVESCKHPPHGGQIFELYNCLMDIYVNRNAANKAAVFQNGPEYSALVKDLYLTKAFPVHDLTQLPLAKQYANYLLLTGMGVQRAYTVSPEIKEIFDQGIVLGSTMTYQEVIESFLVPALGRQKDSRWQATIGQRDVLIQKLILPIYLKLIEQDEREGRGPKQQSGDGDRGGPEITKHLSPDEAQELLEAIRSIIKEERLTTAERAQRDLERQAYQMAEAANLENPSDFAERMCRVQPTVDRLVRAFLEFRAPSTTRIRRLSHHSTQGILDVPEATRKFGQILRDPKNAEVMRQERMVVAKEKTPINIRTCLLPDLSGSMSPCLEGLRDNVIALAAAGATLCQIHKHRQSGIVSELAVYGFESALHEILEPRPDASLIDVAEAYQHIKAMGGTLEYLALEHVLQKLPEFKARDSRRGGDDKVVNLILSLTDGDTERSSRSIDAKLQLLQAGCEPFGIFLRSSGPSGATFREIWGDRGYEINAVEELPTTIQEILRRISRR
jgi:hypothetical protein